MIPLDAATWQALVRLYADYAAAVDSGDWDLWPEFFVDDCTYRLVPRENHERNLPLATLAFESKAMLKDRVYGIRETLFPSVILQQQVNSVSTRHIQPDGHGAFDFVWTHFGFADDSEEMTRRRLRQANLFGPAGFVSADDGEVIELSQQGFEQKPFHRTLAELGGTEGGDTEHMVTETLIRGMYRYWREVMEA